MVFILLNVTLGSLASGRDEGSPILRGRAKKTCECEAFSDTGTSPRVVHAGAFICETCEVQKVSLSGLPSAKEQVRCDCGDMVGIYCPLECVDLKPQYPYTKEELLIALKSKVKTFKDSYEKRIPSKVLERISKDHPDWIPAIYNKDQSPYFINLNLAYYFSLEIPKSVEDKRVDILLVFYFENFNSFRKNQPMWSFWDAETFKLLHESRAPYPLAVGSHLNFPCVVPGGERLDQLKLFGIIAGPFDAAGCCGPYSLEGIREGRAPRLASKKDNAVFSVEYELCGKWNVARPSDEIRGLRKINGPANLREFQETSLQTTVSPDGEFKNRIIEPNTPERSKVIWQCGDGSNVAVMRQKGDWYLVQCEGKIGWTHKKNIRWK